VRGSDPSHRVLEAVAEQESVDASPARRGVPNEVEVSQALQGIGDGTLGKAQLVLELSQRGRLFLERDELHGDQEVDGEESCVHPLWTQSNPWRHDMP
jgi:hypothetical protein